MIVDFFHHFGLVFKKSLRKLFPIALLFSWLQLVQNLFLSPYSFIAITTNAKIFSNKWFLWFSDQLAELSKMVLIMLAATFLYYFVAGYTSEKKEKNNFLPMFTFFLTWLIYSSSYHIDNAFPIEPTWLFLGFLGVGLHFLGQKIKKQHRTVTLIFFVMVTFLAIRTGKFLMAKMTFGMDFLEEAISSSLIGKGPTSFSSVFLWSAVGIFFRMTGLTVPFIFQNQAIDLTVTNDNLQAALTGHLNSIPHFHTLYTLRDSFAMFGGLGMILPMLFAIILYARKHKNKELLKLGYLTFIPIIVDQPIALILGLPIILEPILLIPMVIVTIGAEAIGALLLTLKWINPAVYAVPYGTPSLIFGFLASNGDWRYFFAVSIILVLSTLVYFPFLDPIFNKETQGE